MGRKIEDEEKSLNDVKSNLKSKSKSGRSKSSTKAEDSSQNIPVKTGSVETIVAEDSVVHDGLQPKLESTSDEDLSEGKRNPLQDIAEMGGIRSAGPSSPSSSAEAEPRNPNAVNMFTVPLPSEIPLKVPRSNPLKQNIIPPEVVFFGDPRRPPPVAAARDPDYQSSLLFWARHCTVAPRTAADRLELVFPKGKAHPQANALRLDPQGLTFDKIYNTYVSLKDDLEKSKAFINCNMDIVPSKLVKRAITAKKLTAQSKNELDKMESFKQVLREYIVAHDQVFFPLNIETRKAETRVMTFVGRDEVRDFARGWDEVECTLYFVVLLAARMTWNDKVNFILRGIETRVKDTVAYMADNVRRDLMTRELTKPSLTAEVYTNTSSVIASAMPEFYEKVAPEIRLVHETFDMKQPQEVLRYVTEEFAPKNKISVDELKSRLLMLEATAAGIQGRDYNGIRKAALFLHGSISSEADLRAKNKWYADEFANGFGFRSYEPDTVPDLVEIQQRNRDTGNAFTNFAVQVMKMPTAYTDAFSGKRPKASTVGAWLERDPEYSGIKRPVSAEDELQRFREAYLEQMKLRQDAEKKLGRVVINRMESQDRMMQSGIGYGSIMDFQDEEDGDQGEDSA